MAILAVDPSTSIVSAVAATHNEFNATMASSETWVLSSNVGCWYKQGTHAALTTAGASAASGSVYLAAGVDRPIDGKAGTDLSIILDGATPGKASLARAITK